MRRASLPARLALLAIRGYQRYLSPIKGYSCALRAETGGESCSAYGHRVVARRGLRTGLRLLQRRLDLCGHAYRHAASHVHGPLYHQRGVCDVGCDILDCGSMALDVADCFSGCSPCDHWPFNRKKRGKPPAIGDSAQLDALRARVDAARHRHEESPGP